MTPTPKKLTGRFCARCPKGTTHTLENAKGRLCIEHFHEREQAKKEKEKEPMVYMCSVCSVPVKRPYTLRYGLMCRVHRLDDQRRKSRDRYRNEKDVGRYVQHPFDCGF